MRASPEKKQERERVRHELMRATLRLSGTHGFAGLGLREVAREADIAPTSFYRHFTDIEELGRALIEQLVAPLVAELSRAVEEASQHGGDPVRALVDGVLLAAIGDPDLLRFVLAERYGVNALFRRRLRDSLAELTGTLQRCLPWLGVTAADAALLVLLEGCNSLLESAPELRIEARETLSPPLRSTLATMLGTPPEEA